MLRLPPLECLRFFECAGRRQNFARAAAELGVTPGAVSYRIRKLEEYVGVQLFDRLRRGVRLNRDGQAYLKDVQRILAEILRVSERQCRWPRPIRIVSVEAVAELWLAPRLASFCESHPGIAFEIETNHRHIDPDRCEFDCWFAYSGDTAAPRPVTRRDNSLLEETLHEEQLIPVASPALTAARGPVRSPVEIKRWPLLYDLGWDSDWSYWFARQGQPAPDLSRASGFRLYSTLVRAAIDGLGVAIGRPMLIASELAGGALVPLLDCQAEAPERCCLITNAASRQRREVQAFREWVLREADTLAGQPKDRRTGFRHHR